MKSKVFLLNIFCTTLLIFNATDTVLWKSVLARNSAVIECINAKQVLEVCDD